MIDNSFQYVFTLCCMFYSSIWFICDILLILSYETGIDSWCHLELISETLKKVEKLKLWQQWLILHFGRSLSLNLPMRLPGQQLMQLHGQQSVYLCTAFSWASSDKLTVQLWFFINNNFICFFLLEQQDHVQSSRVIINCILKLWIHDSIFDMRHLEFQMNDER